MLNTYPWHAWCLAQLGTIEQVIELAAEASARRYYRLVSEQGARTTILMDASELIPAAQAHLSLTAVLLPAGIRVPHVVASQVDQGWILLEDFGDTSLCDSAQQPQGSFFLKQAVNTLLAWQAWGSAWESKDTLPLLSAPMVERKIRLFQQYVLGEVMSSSEAKACQAVYDRVLLACANQPTVVLHRDYHGRNLLCLDEEKRVGVIDFQDAHRGPLAYDLVSVLKDAYVDWGDDQRAVMTRYYHNASGTALSYDAFMQGFDWLGIGRHIKCLGLFTRLAKQGKRQYLDYLPRLARYLLLMADRYAELSPLVPALEAVLIGKEDE